MWNNIIICAIYLCDEVNSAADGIVPMFSKTPHSAFITEKAGDWLMQMDHVDARDEYVVRPLCDPTTPAPSTPRGWPREWAVGGSWPAAAGRVPPIAHCRRPRHLTRIAVDRAHTCRRLALTRTPA